MNMRNPPTWDRVAALFTKALAHGADRPHPYRVEWNTAPWCECPHGVTVHAKPDQGVRKAPGSKWVEIDPPYSSAPLTVVMQVPCRTCTPCLRKKAAKWKFRARTETGAACRTWFGTLTFSPEWRYWLMCKASSRAHRRGVKWADLKPSERFGYLATSAGELATKWLKRVRKQSGVKFRYLLVVEEHKSGDPHFHVLIHEIFVLTPVRKSVLKSQWSHGFSKWKLVEDLRTADYVCKYVSKSLMARVRASVRYGKHGLIPIAIKREKPRP